MLANPDAKDMFDLCSDPVKGIIKGFEDTARSGAEMRRLIAAQTAVIAAAIAPSLKGRVTRGRDRGRG